MSRSAALALLLAPCLGSCLSIAALVTGGDAGDGGPRDGGEAGLEASALDAADAGVAVDAAGADGARGCPGPYAQAVMALPGLVGYWRLDEPGGAVAADRTGKHPGTYLPGVTLRAPGLLVGDPDLAAAFDGEGGSFVDVPAATDLDLQTFTLGAIIEPSAIVAADKGQQIVAKSGAFWLQLDAPTNAADHPHLEVGIITPGTSGADYPLTQPSASLGVGVVSHVVGTYDGNAVSLYVDGVLIDFAPLSASVKVTANDLFIGSWDGTTNFQAGTIDEVFVSSVALRAEQVSSLYRAARGCAYDAGD